MLSCLTGQRPRERLGWVPSCTLFKSLLAAPPSHPSRAQILPQESGLRFLLFISLGSDRATAGRGLLSPAPSASGLTTLTPLCPSGPRLAEELWDAHQAPLPTR